MEALIVHSPTLFDDQSNLASYASSPPLPPAPLGEIPPPFAYGSAHTKVSGYGPQQPLPQAPTPQTSTSDDFTPQFPPRPPASIHPSSRGNSGSTNGLSNTSSTWTDAETNHTSPTTFTSAPPLPLRAGRQGALTPIQGLRGTKGLDFSHQEIGEGDRTGSSPTSPPLSDPPPTSPPSAFKSPQMPPPPPPSAFHQSALALQQQQQQVALSHQRPALSQIQIQEQPQPKEQPPPSLPTIEGSAIGDFEPIGGPFESFSSSKVDDGHSTDHTNSITPDAPTGPTPQPVTSQPLTQQEPQAPAQLRTQSQVPIKGAQVQEQSRPSPAHSLRQPDEIPQGRRESQDLPPSQFQ